MDETLTKFDVILDFREFACLSKFDGNDVNLLCHSTPSPPCNPRKRIFSQGIFRRRTAWKG